MSHKIYCTEHKSRMVLMEPQEIVFDFEDGIDIPETDTISFGGVDAELRCIEGCTANPDDIYELIERGEIFLGD